MGKQILLSLACAVILTCSAWAEDGAAAYKVYETYDRVFLTTTNPNDLVPYLSRQTLQKITSLAPDQQAGVLGDIRKLELMMRSMAPAPLKLKSFKRQGSRAILTLEAKKQTREQGGTSTASVQQEVVLVQEAGEWKVDLMKDIETVLQMQARRGKQK